MNSVYLLILLFFFIALIYSSVGFGGGSSYLALMALPVFFFLPAQIRFMALICNIVVVSGSSIIFLSRQKIRIATLLPYLLPSVPMAYVGGWWKLSDHLYYLVLSFTLICASALLWFKVRESVVSANIPSLSKIAVSGSIGLLSGLVGIGGGIFLSPVMHLFRWATAAEISAIAATFILVNSISGLAGQLLNGAPEIDPKILMPLILAVFAGGQIGARLGVGYFNPLWIRRITAMVILLAAIILLREHL
jgi:uncharacterized membrane protein YfcA